jgi:hypothetical protein
MKGEGVEGEGTGEGRGEYNAEYNTRHIGFRGLSHNEVAISWRLV